MFLPLSKVLAAVTTVFVEHDLSFANDRLTLTDGRFQKLVNQVTAASGTTPQILERRADDKAGAIVGMSVARILARVSHKDKDKDKARASPGSAVVEAIVAQPPSALMKEDGDEEDRKGASETGTAPTATSPAHSSDGGDGAASASQQQQPRPQISRPPPPSLSTRLSERLLSQGSQRLLSQVSERALQVDTTPSKPVTFDRGRGSSSRSGASTRSAASTPVASTPSLAQPLGFPPNTVIVDVDTTLWLCMHMFMEQSTYNRAQMQALYHAFDEDGSGTLSLVEFHALIQACCPDKLSDRLIANLFAEVVAMDRAARQQLRKAQYVMHAS